MDTKKLTKNVSSKVEFHGQHRFQETAQLVKYIIYTIFFDPNSSLSFWETLEG